MLDNWIFIKLGCLIFSIYKVNLKRIKDLNVKVKIIKFIEENIEVSFFGSLVYVRFFYKWY